MAPFNPLYTNRLRISYTGPFGRHKMLFHGVTGVSPGVLAGAVGEVIDAMKELCYDDTSFSDAEYAAAGSNLFFPFGAWGGYISNSGNTPNVNTDPSRFLQFGGRSLSTGRRVKYYLFETYFLPRQDMRWDEGESALIDTVIAAIKDNATVIGAIDGNSVGWYEYANIGSNDYLVHKARA